VDDDRHGAPTDPSPPAPTGEGAKGLGGGRDVGGRWIRLSWDDENRPILILW
jgi:hypothetical protein